MNDDVVRLSAIGRVVRRRWRQLTVFALIGAALGAGASVLSFPGYETSSSIVLQGQRSEDEVLTEAQIAMSSVVLDRTAAALAWGMSGAELRDSVSVKIADGNVIEVKGTAGSPHEAQELTDQVVEEYVTYSVQLVSSPTNASSQLLQEKRDALRQQVAQTNQRLTALHSAVESGRLTVDSVQARTELEALRSGLAGAIKELDEAEATSSQANLVVLGSAELPANTMVPTAAQWAAGGALGFFALGLFAQLAIARADRRLRSEAEIATALGSAMLATVDEPEAPNIAGPSPTSRTWRGRLRRLVRDDHPWYSPPLPVPDDAAGRHIRYRRVLARLRDAPNADLRLLVLIADDDATALRAVAHLALAAGVDGGAASVMTDRADFSDLVRAAGHSAGTRNAQLTIQPSADPVRTAHRTVLHVVEVSAARPTVPESPDVSGALVVTTAGTRTGWELVGIAEACADAGHDVVGTVVIFPAAPIGKKPPEAGKVVPPPVSVNGNVMAGSA